MTKFTKEKIEKRTAELRAYKVKMIGDYKGMGNKTEFMCPYCSSIFLSMPRRIFSEHTQSCGCIRGMRRRRGTKHVSHTYWRVVKLGAKARNYYFDIDIEYIDQLLFQQKFKCALSGSVIVAGYNTNLTINNIAKRKENGEDIPRHTASLDRIDNNKGYIEGNVQWLHADINLMKHAYDQDYFLEMCSLCTEHQKSKV